MVYMVIEDDHPDHDPQTEHDRLVTLELGPVISEETTKTSQVNFIKLAFSCIYY